MTQIKKKLFCMIAIVMALCTAFTSSKPGPLSWRFTGNECDWTQRVNPVYYVADFPTCISGVNHFCKIVAYGAAGRPIITYQSALYNYLENDQDILPQPATGLIYLKE
jgi:hypothetical protein